MFRVISMVRYGVSNSFHTVSMFKPQAAVISMLPIYSSNPSGCVCYNINYSRNLFTETALGIEKLTRVQEKKQLLFSGPGRDRYLERLKTYIKTGETRAIIKDDLINLIGIAENDDHLDLLEEVIKCSDTNQADLVDGWGAALMRLYFKMGKLERAYANMKNVEKFGEFFNHTSCYKIMMTMLYNAGRYEEVVDIFHHSERRLSSTTDRNNINPSYDLVILTFASLAKMNNKGALNAAESLFNQLSKDPARKPGLRPASFLAYIAVNNDEPTYAMNLISTVKANNYISLRELKIIALIKLKRYEDILLKLREFSSAVRQDSTILLRSTLHLIKENADKLEDADLRQELKDILVELDKGGNVSDATLDELLFKPVDRDTTRPPPRPRYQNRLYQ